MPTLLLIGLWKRGTFGRRLFGCMRAGAYLCVVATAIAVLLATRAKAQLREQSLALGKELSPVADLLDGATALRINGQRLNFSMSFKRDLDVRQALDRFQAQCEAHPGPIVGELRRLAAALPDLPGKSLFVSLVTDMTLTRQQSATEGALLCFTGSAPEGDLVENFERTRDLGALGRLRYVRVERNPADGAGVTRVTALWTEDSLKLESFEPPAFGDAPGSDSPLAPRPPGGIRILSAEAVGSAYAVRVYESNASPEEVLAFYDRSMAGWERFTLPDQERRGRGYIASSRPLLVQVSRDETKTLVILSEAGGRGDMDTLLR